jgi:hypothetical protein
MKDKMLGNYDIKNIIETIQPFYEQLNVKYSKSYLKGSCWYVGDSLMEWWNKASIRNYQQNIRTLIGILDILILNKKNEYTLLNKNEIEVVSSNQ